MDDQKSELGRLIATALISGSMAAALVGGGLKYYLDGRLEEFRERRSHDIATLTELVAPGVMLLSRSGAVAKRYQQNGNQYFGDALILSDVNRRMRELLLTKAHLIPLDLIDPSKCLAVHYDLWLRRFDAELAEYQAANNGLLPKPDDPFDIGYASLTNGADECGEFPEGVPDMYEKEEIELKGRLSE